tara:strand:- start:5734 stop:5955 length:222 start_codon:yes stop_codon:yes gene_type:complete
MHNLTITVDENLHPYRDALPDAKLPTELARFATTPGVAFDYDELENLVEAVKRLSGSAGDPVTVKVSFETTNF